MYKLMVKDQVNRCIVARGKSSKDQVQLVQILAKNIENVDATAQAVLDKIAGAQHFGQKIAVPLASNVSWVAIARAQAKSFRDGQ